MFPLTVKVTKLVEITRNTAAPQSYRQLVMSAKEPTTEGILSSGIRILNSIPAYDTTFILMVALSVYYIFECLAAGLKKEV